jgi:hypothetical protein
MAKSGNLDFMENFKFARVNFSIRKVLKEMLNPDPSLRVSSIQILSMMKVAIPIISQNELNRIQKEKPEALFKLKANTSNVVNCDSLLGKRSDPFLKSSEINHENLCSKVKNSFSFPVLDMSTKPPCVSTQTSSSVASLASKAQPKDSPSKLLESNNYSMLNDFMKMKAAQKNDQFSFCIRTKKAKSAFFIKPNSNTNKCFLNSKIPFSLNKNIRLCKKKIKSGSKKDLGKIAIRLAL